MKFWTALTVLFFVYYPCFFISTYGTRWEFGQYGVYRSLTFPGGQTYLDGSPVDPFTAELIRAGIEEEVMLCFAFLLLALFVALIRILRRGNRLRLEHRRVREALEAIRKQEDQR